MGRKARVIVSSVTPSSGAKIAVPTGTRCLGVKKGSPSTEMLLKSVYWSTEMEPILIRDILVVVMLVRVVWMNTKLSVSSRVGWGGTRLLLAANQGLVSLTISKLLFHPNFG
jgi:hypothetical protein